MWMSWFCSLWRDSCWHWYSRRWCVGLVCSFGKQGVFLRSEEQRRKRRNAAPPSKDQLPLPKPVVSCFCHTNYILTWKVTLSNATDSRWELHAKVSGHVLSTDWRYIQARDQGEGRSLVEDKTHR
jgi:hypothetical protein